ncbi:MAG: phage portal protein, partial [Parafilimonas terrae]|nr:phage portal protein [Parafilimonas terrae]
MPHTLRKRYPRAAPAATARRSYGPPTLLSSGQLAGGITIPTLSGTPINAQTALSIAAVWNAVLIYANTIASLDFHIARRTGRNGQARTADRKHPSYELVSLTPNGVQTSFRFRQTIVSHAVCRGNGYAEILRAGGRPVALCLMDPTQVTPMVAEDGRLVYQVAGADGPLEARDVLHIAGMGWDGVSGYSPITLNAEALGLAKAEQTWQSGLFGNNATPNGHYEIPGALAKEAKDEFRRQVNLMHGGPSRSGKFGILDGGAKWVQTSFSPSDAQLILGRQFSIAEVARIFNLPQHLLGQLDKATFSNIEEQNIQFYQISLMPWLVSIEQEFTRKLLPRSEWSTYAAWFDPATLLRGNLQARTSHAVQMNRIGVASINDVAEEFGYERVGSPGADKHWVSTNNLTAIEDMDRAAPAAEAAPADDTPDPVQVSAIQNAQLASLLETVAALSEGGLTVPAAKAALRISFPALSDAQIDALLDPLAKPEKPPTTEPPGESPTPPVVKPRQPRAKRIPSKPKEPSETILEPSQGPPEARAESAKPPKRRERRDKAPGSGGCGTGHGGFKAGNKCGKRGSKSSIGDPAPRSPLDAARDRFSSAKAGHAAALSAHRAAPTEKTAA